MPPRRIQKLAFPAKGLSENFGYEDQPPGTTPDAENVRPHTYGVTKKGRMRGGSRPGLSPFVEAVVDGTSNKAELKFRQGKTTDTAVNLPIQEIVQIPASEFDEYLGDGRVFHAGLTDDRADRDPAEEEDAGASSSQLNAGTATTNAHNGIADRTYCCSAWDSDGNCYVAAVKELNNESTPARWDTGTPHTGDYDVEIYKFDRAGARSIFTGGYDESFNVCVPCRVERAGRQVLGIAVHNSIIYVWVRNLAGSGETALAGSFIFRIGTDGAMKDEQVGGVWQAWADSHGNTSTTITDGRGLLDSCAGPTEDIWITESSGTSTSTITADLNNLLYASRGVLYVLTTGVRSTVDSGTHAWVFMLDIQSGTKIQAHAIQSIEAPVSISSVVAGDPTTINTSASHNLITGDIVNIKNAPPALGSAAINGNNTVTVTTPTQFTIEVDSTGCEYNLTSATAEDARAVPFVYDITGDGTRIWAVTGIGNSSTGTTKDYVDRVSLYDPSLARGVEESNLTGATSALYLGLNSTVDDGKSKRLRSVAYDPINGLVMVSGEDVCGTISGAIAALHPDTLDVSQYQIGTVGKLGGGSGSSPTASDDVPILYGSLGFDQAVPDFNILIKVGNEVIRVTGTDSTASGALRDATFTSADGRGSCGTTAVTLTPGDPIYRLVNMEETSAGVALTCIRVTGYDVREDYPGTSFAVTKNAGSDTVRLLSNFNIARDSNNNIVQEGTNALGLDKNNKILGSKAGYTYTGSLGNGVGDELAIGGAISAQFVPRETVASDYGTRSLQLLAVCGGEIANFEKDRFSNRDTSTAARSAVLSINSSYIDSAVFGGNAYFCDGHNYVTWFGAGRFPTLWAATSGDLPTDRTGRGANLAATWRGRIVLSGVVSEPRNWFMSALGDPLNWDYFPPVTLETQAVAGNNSDAGLSGDIINALIPYSDDLLLFGGDQTIWQMTGDPMSGGRLDLVADITGIAFGKAWCKDPFGTIYFFGSKGGVYRMFPGQKPEMLSHTAIAEPLQQIDVDNTIIRLAWNQRELGVHIFLTPLDLSVSTKHFFYDIRTDSWWRDSFTSSNHNPTAVAEVDGFTADDRHILLGVQDGGILKWDRDATTDNGKNIASHVFVGPIRASNPLSSVRLEEIEGVLAAGSTGGETIDYSIHKGATAEEAVASPSFFSGKLSGNTRMVDRRRATGNKVYLKIFSNQHSWAMENFSCIVSELPPSSSRRFR